MNGTIERQRKAGAASIRAGVEVRGQRGGGESLLGRRILLKAEYQIQGLVGCVGRGRVRKIDRGQRSVYISGKRRNKGSPALDERAVRKRQGLMINTVPGLNIERDRPRQILIDPTRSRHARVRNGVNARERVRPRTGKYQHNRTNGQRKRSQVEAFERREVEDQPGRHHAEQWIDRQLIAHGWVESQRLPYKIDRGPKP